MPRRRERTNQTPMELSASHMLQLAFALLFGVLLFVAAYTVREKWVVMFVVVLLPFQLITSPYGSSSTVLIYIVAGAALLKGRMKSRPFLLPFSFILLVDFIAMSQAPRGTYFDHLFYEVSAVSNFLCFYLVYNYVIRAPDAARNGMQLLIACSVGVAIYSALQLFAGFDRIVVLGIDELAGAQNLESKKRLMGPFLAAGVNGAFYGMQIILLAYMAMTTSSRGRFLLFVMGLAAVNFGFLVATGSRGSFITTLGGLALLFVAMLRHLGVMRTLSIGFAATVLFSIAAVFVIEKTEFNVLFERFKATEVRGFVPDSRTATFDLALERIPDKLVTGHGPRLRLIREELRRIPGYKPMYYAHNLYLHVAFTRGLLGIAAYFVFFVALLVWYLRAWRFSSDDKLLAAAPRLGVVVTLFFLVDELKIEFLRFGLFDYQNYMFAFWAVTCALSTKLRSEALTVTRRPLLARREKPDGDLAGAGA